MTTHPASPELERFVRETLGCNCPAEVFEQVDEAPSTISLAAGIDRRVAIGGRLLIYLVEVRDAAEALRGLAGWIAAGRAEREAEGMNRLRLVLALDDVTAESRAAIQRAFDALPAVDERIHLHI